MTNPWTKKNPLLSMWLSGANAALGASRGLALAESQRLATTWMTRGTEQMVDFWTDAMTGGLARRAAPRRAPAKRTKRR